MENEVEKIEVIRTQLSERGSVNTEWDPPRKITQYWTTDGGLLFEYDPYEKTRLIEEFQNWYNENNEINHIITNDDIILFLQRPY